MQLFNVGQVGTDRPGVSIKYIRKTTVVRNSILGCAFVSTFNKAVALENAQGTQLVDNVFFNTLRTTVDVDASVRNK